AVGRYHSLTEVEVSGSDQWLLTADNRGFITVWDGQALMQCVRDAAQPLVSRADVDAAADATSDSAASTVLDETTPLPCSLSSIQRDQWQATEDGAAVRAMSLLTDGCYVATAAADGAIALWPLDPSTGMRRAEPSVIHRFEDHLPYAIDLKQEDDRLLIAADGPNNRVWLRDVAIDAQTRCASPL
ncbi:MAG: hypothetical protein ACFB4J_08435, partial [Elainellaceae cyanobacterium]